MNALLPLAEQAIVNRVLSKKAPFMRKNKFGLGLAALSGLLLFMALVFAVLSGYGWLLTQFSQPVAALIVSGVIAAVSVISGVAGYILLKKKQPAPSILQDNNEITDIVSEIAELIGEELAEPIQQNPKTAMLLAGVAGFVAGDRLH